MSPFMSGWPTNAVSLGQLLDGKGSHTPTFPSLCSGYSLIIEEMLLGIMLQSCQSFRFDFS